jgi:uncharacterized membrane protein YeaQ/YmgE (transglycosylase-associated protein family)
MGIVAWIVLGLVAGMLAKMLFPEKSPGIVITCVLGVCGALLGGWLFHLHTLNGFFNLPTWLTAIAGAAVLLMGYQLATGRPGHQAARR